ncbi:hypothetical protein BCR44DRAFT_1113212 [Catenaria anguillulae PL171]|uniref:Uncharacterized protein n=1 Tax=Catenaria anguillulae PL171 TaxID=765915 RepID=A0A1Y2H5T9_9FUNG|nr:hypothetical protein BCR44DRAFT_1113212 [Catenaria anguillulae PL171]
MASATSTSSSSPKSAKSDQNQPKDQEHGRQPQHPEQFEPEARYRQYPPHQLYYPPAPEHRPLPPPPTTHYQQHHQHRSDSQSLPAPPVARPSHSFPPASSHHNDGHRPSSPGPASGSAGAHMHSYQYQGYPPHQQPPAFVRGAVPGTSSSPGVIRIGEHQHQPIPFYPPPTAPAQAGPDARQPHYHQQHGQQQQQLPPAPVPLQYDHHSLAPPHYPSPIQPPPYQSWPLIAPSPLPPQPLSGGATSGHFSVHSGGSSGQWSTHPTGPGTGRRTVTEAPLSLTQNATQFKSPEHKRKVADYARLMLGADPDASPSFLPYRSFGEAVSLNPIYVSIGALSVYCTLCQKAFKMSTKCNLRFVQRHEQSLKHTDQLRKILAEFPPLDEAGNPTAASAATSSKTHAPKPTTDTSGEQGGDAVSSPAVNTGSSTAPSSRASTSVVSTPAASRPSSSSPPPSTAAADSAAAWASTSGAASASNLGSSVIAKKAYLEESFVKHVENNPLFTIVDETTVFCLPCSKRLKLDRARSPRTVLLHCASQVHLIKLNKYRLGEQTSAQQQVLGGSAASSETQSPAVGGQEQPASSERRSPNLPAIVTSTTATADQGHFAAQAHGLVTPESAAEPSIQPQPVMWSSSAPGAAPAAESSALPPFSYAHPPPLPPTDRRYILPLPTPTWPVPMHHPSGHAQHQPQPLMSPNKHATPLQSPPPSATSWSRYLGAPGSAAAPSMNRRASPYPTASNGAVPLPVSSAATPQLQSPPPARRSNSANTTPSTPPVVGLQGSDRGSVSPTGSTGSQSAPGGQKMSLQFLVD